MKSMTSVILVVAIALFLLGGGAGYAASKDQFPYDDLYSSNPEVRERARELLDKHKFSRNDLPLLYEAIQRSYRDDDAGANSTRSALLTVLWTVNDRSTVNFVKKAYPTLPDNPDIRYSALRVLSEMNTADSLNLFLDLLIGTRPNLEHFYFGLFVPLYEHTRNAKVLFPRLLELLSDKRYRYPVYSLAVYYRDKKLIANGVFAGYRERMIEDFNQAEVERAALLESSAEEYSSLSDLLAVIVDGMGSFLKDPEIAGILRESLDDPDPGVKLYSAISLVRVGEKVSPESLGPIAANPATRLDLYEALKEMGQARFFPQAYFTQYHFAEGDMVRWLCYPTEFGRPPDRIELLETREITRGGVRGRVYLFKYFYNDDKDGWMVGMSGPQPIKMNELRTWGELTFSHFNKMDEMSIEEHFESFLDPEIKDQEIEKDTI